MYFDAITITSGAVPTGAIYYTGGLYYGAGATRRGIPSEDILDETIRAEDIGVGAVGSEEIADEAVTNAKLASDAIPIRRKVTWGSGSTTSSGKKVIELSYTVPRKSKVVIYGSVMAYNTGGSWGVGVGSGYGVTRFWYMGRDYYSDYRATTIVGSWDDVPAGTYTAYVEINAPYGTTTYYGWWQQLVIEMFPGSPSDSIEELPSESVDENGFVRYREEF